MPRRPYETTPVRHDGEAVGLMYLFPDEQPCEAAYDVEQTPGFVGLVMFTYDDGETMTLDAGFRIRKLVADDFQTYLSRVIAFSPDASPEFIRRAWLDLHQDVSDVDPSVVPP